MIEAFRLGIVSRGATLWDGLDFAFEDGSATVITGPPSCGKTLLLSILRGERRPDAGEVLFSGQSLYRAGVSAAGGFRASCGYVPERLDADDRLTVNGLFLRSAMVRPGASAPERRERLLDLMGLSGKEDVRLSSLSVSERARAALAAELSRDPKVLFTDGAVRAAGAPYEERMGTLFRQLAGSGTLILAAERELPREWEGFAGQGVPAGPFLVYSLPPIVAKGEAD